MTLARRRFEQETRSKKRLLGDICVQAGRDPLRVRQPAQQGDAYLNSVIPLGSIWKMKSLRLERMASPPLPLR